jgi:ABC-type bacteriocin/lantibiotic exporter with double-glycine peptidase domain
MRLKRYIDEQIGGGTVGIIPDSAVILDYPELRQYGSYDCGALALQSVLIYYGMDINETTVIQQLGTTEENGTPVPNMIAGAKFYGLEVEARNGMTIRDLRNAINQEHPTIITLQAWADYDKRHSHGWTYKDRWDEGHYVVAIGYDDSKIYFQDPSDPRRTWLSNDVLDERWHDEDEPGSRKYEHWGMTCMGAPIYRSNQMVFMETRRR